MGFATAENMTFVLQGGAGLAVMRMLSAIPAHFVFAVIMGYYLGKAKSSKEISIFIYWIVLINPCSNSFTL